VSDFLEELYKALETYELKESKHLLWKAIRIYHGYLFRSGYQITYVGKQKIRKENKKSSRLLLKNVGIK
jgi:hypothetical protein